MSFSCGRVVQFVIVGPLHRKRSEGADDEERTTIRSPRERSEPDQTPPKTLQPQCQPQAGARLPPRKPKRKPPTKTKSVLVLVLVARSRWSSQLHRAPQAAILRRPHDHPDCIAAHADASGRLQGEQPAAAGGAGPTRSPRRSERPGREHHVEHSPM